MEVNAAARRMLLGYDPVRGYVVDKVYRDRLGEPLEGTAGRALVIVRGPGWAGPNRQQPTRFPTLITKSYADPDRDENGDVAVSNAADKAYALDGLLNKVLHNVQEAYWGAKGSDPGRLIISSYRAAEPVAARQGEAHAGGEQLGELVMVRSVWNIETV